MFPYRTAAAVVVYNPQHAHILMINSLAHQVDRLFIVDNSTAPNDLSGLLTKSATATYLSLGGNFGIATALNVACEAAIQSGFDFLFTLDQDAEIGSEWVHDMLAALENISLDNIGMISPSYKPIIRSSSRRYREVLLSITSGSLINLNVYRRVGGFLEKLFIDHVDHEYCLRLKTLGFGVIQLMHFRTPHYPGTKSERTIMGCFKISIWSQPPIRTYYFCRNGLLVSLLYGRKFPGFVFYFTKRILMEVIKTFFLTEKGVRFKMIWAGFRDFNAKQFGAAPASVQH